MEFGNCKTGKLLLTNFANRLQNKTSRSDTLKRLLLDAKNYSAVLKGIFKLLQWYSNAQTLVGFFPLQQCYFEVFSRGRTEFRMALIAFCTFSCSRFFKTMSSNLCAFCSCKLINCFKRYNSPACKLLC